MEPVIVATLEMKFPLASNPSNIWQIELESRTIDELMSTGEFLIMVSDYKIGAAINGMEFEFLVSQETVLELAQDLEAGGED